MREPLRSNETTPFPEGRRCLFLAVLLALAFLGNAMTVCFSGQEPGANSVIPREGLPGAAESETGHVKMDFEDVDILVFIKAMSEVTGKDFVVSPKVRGKVHVVTPKEIPVDEADQVFQSVLEVHGFTTVPAGSVVKIVPSSEARGKGVDTQPAR
jgi:type II secretory pathway component GspD/PulD (secretin)